MRLIIVLLLVAIVLSLSHYLIQLQVFGFAPSLVVLTTYFVNVGLIALFHSLLMLKKKSAPKTFVNTYMAFMGLKMMFAFIIFLILGLFFKEVLAGIAVAFIGSYLLFTGIETYFLLKDLKSSR